MKAWLWGVFGGLALCAAPAIAEDAGAESAPFASGVRFRFVQAEEARAFLGEADAFVDGLSEADMRLRFGVTEADYAARAEAAARSWSPDEIANVRATIALMQEGFEAAHVALPLPEEVLLIRTDGSEEGNAGGYTRGDAIIFTDDELVRQPPAQLVGLLAHELFHVATRRRPDVRDDLYAIIGFTPCAPLTFPPALAQRRVSDPDAHLYDHCIAITHDGAALTAIPILLLKDFADGEAPENLFEALDVELLSVRADGTAATDAEGAPLLIALQDSPDYARSVGANTGYVINPEEIMADNFSLLVRGVDGVPNPDILERISETLSTD